MTNATISKPHPLRSAHLNRGCLWLRVALHPTLHKLISWHIRVAKGILDALNVDKTTTKQMKHSQKQPEHLHKFIHNAKIMATQQGFGCELIRTYHTACPGRESARNPGTCFRFCRRAHSKVHPQKPLQSGECVQSQMMV